LFFDVLPWLSYFDQTSKYKARSTKYEKANRKEMILARVLGNVVATQKNHRYESARVMMCEQMTPEGDMTGHTVLALDAVDAGVGDTVLIVQEGWSASTVATGKAGAAIDSAIVGVVDRIDLLDEANK
jgi:microcompartment protein CcmK/EutM